MPGDSSATASARPSSSSSSTNALRKRGYHLLERASRSFTAAEPNARSDDENDNDNEQEESQSLPSPVTSYEETGYHDEEEGAEDDAEGDEDEKAAPGALDADGSPAAADAHLTGYFQDDEIDDDEHGPPRPWYKPSLPIILALAPPIGNWLTGGDHLKDLVLLLLLIFYLHQLIEIPWSLYRSARPRRSPTPSTPTPSPASALHIAAAKSQLRSLELLLLTVCVLTPVLGVLLLRSLASFTSSSPTPNAAATTTPISWFSTTLFGLITAIRPLRELVSRVSTRTSTLHDQIHNTTASSSSHHRPSSATKDGELASLRAQLARLEQALADLTARDEALYAYVEDAVAPLEKGVRRVERRVGKLKNNVKKQQEVIVSGSNPGAGGKGKGKGRSGGGMNTIFVPAAGAAGTGGGGGIGHGAQEAARAIIRSWFGSGEEAGSAPPLSPLQTNGFGGAGNGKGRRAMLDSIPEEGEGSVYARSSSGYPASSSSSSATAAPYASTSAANPSPPSYYAAARHPFHPHPQHPHHPHTQPHPYQYNQYAPQHPAPLVRRLLAAAFLWPVWVVLAPTENDPTTLVLPESRVSDLPADSRDHARLKNERMKVIRRWISHPISYMISPNLIAHVRHADRLLALPHLDAAYMTPADGTGAYQTAAAAIHLPFLVSPQHLSAYRDTTDEQRLTTNDRRPASTLPSHTTAVDERRRRAALAPGRREGCILSICRRVFVLAHVAADAKSKSKRITQPRRRRTTDDRRPTPTLLRLPTSRSTTDDPNAGFEGLEGGRRNAIDLLIGLIYGKTKKMTNVERPVPVPNDIPRPRPPKSNLGSTTFAITSPPPPRLSPSRSHSRPQPIHSNLLHQRKRLVGRSRRDARTEAASAYTSACSLAYTPTTLLLITTQSTHLLRPCAQPNALPIPIPISSPSRHQKPSDSLSSRPSLRPSAPILYPQTLLLLVVQGCFIRRNWLTLHHPSSNDPLHPLQHVRLLLPKILASTYAECVVLIMAMR
ncbi:hypothetical protein R3P38DRAFT_3295541 [Favolaschia claudopus]|uniref:Uncharacterized protein n=1 Tax=Favolaschia claudopus TaxID=2862362 RepID=A0AAV9ZAJ9_9AGAR